MKFLLPIPVPNGSGCEKLNHPALKRHLDVRLECLRQNEGEQQLNDLSTQI
jgi:hypothetical protein